MKIISDSVRATTAIGRKLAKCVKPGDIICLYGDLGTGKTALTKGIGEGLGIGECSIISPTFVLMRCHEGRLTLYHFDLYRIQDTHEMPALGYEEFFYSDGVCVIEWAERLGSLAPAEYLKIELEHAGGTKRRLRFFANGSRYEQLLKDFSIAMRKR